MTSAIQCAIIEDEPLAQNILKKYIEDHPALELKAVCNNAEEAQKVLLRQDVELLFLDINLPKLSGVSFLKTLPHQPLVIFTTAYPEYAVEGFELDAIDYLLKPFSFERFLKAANKAVQQLNKKEIAEQTSPSFIFLKADKKVHKVNLDDILYLEAAGDYIKVVTGSGQYIVNDTLKSLQDELPPVQFIRVHKSYIISRNKIKFFAGNYVKVGNADIPIGNSYKEEISTRLKEKNI
jgi:two-component system, LytTR family, response regulator